MGIDTASVIAEIEEVFSMVIPEEEVSRMETVGDILDFMTAESEVPQNDSLCVFALTFYTLRGAAAKLGADGRLRPSDLTSTILPSSRRTRYWSRLQYLSKLMLPPLRRPRWLVKISTAVVILSSVGFGLLVYQSMGSIIGGVVAAIAAGVEFGLIAAMMTWPFAVYPDAECTTLRELAESTRKSNLKMLSDRYKGDGKARLWIAVCAMIVEQLGVTPEEIYPAVSLANDLEYD